MSMSNAVGGIVDGVGDLLGGIGDAIGSFFDSIFGPLTLNLVGGNVHTVSPASSSTRFDMQDNGQVLRTGWITPDEGFLVRDVNGDGRINSGVAEMFSEKANNSGLSAFGMLATLDSNHDLVMDRRDLAWNDLKIWVDKNSDGVSQASELYTLAQLGIASIGPAANDSAWTLAA